MNSSATVNHLYRSFITSDSKDIPDIFSWRLSCQSHPSTNEKTTANIKSNTRQPITSKHSKLRCISPFTIPYSSLLAHTKRQKSQAQQTMKNKRHGLYNFCNSTSPACSLVITRASTREKKCSPGGTAAARSILNFKQTHITPSPSSCHLSNECYYARAAAAARAISLFIVRAGGRKVYRGAARVLYAYLYFIYRYLWRPHGNLLPESFALILM